MSDIRFAVVDTSHYVHTITMAPESFTQFWYYIPSETAQIGDFWTGVGSVFTTPPPPIPGRGDFIDMLNHYLSVKEQARREVLIDNILAGQPAPQTFQDFRDMLALADPT